MKHPISEVIFPLCGEWVVEVYAWAKDLARQLNVSFQVVRFNVADSSISNNPVEHALEGDGYYFVHYSNNPPKTKLENLQGNFESQFLNYLNERKGSIVVIPSSLVSTEFYDTLVGQKNHALISFPSQLQKATDTLEFNNVLKQVAFRHLPFDLFRPENYSLISRITKGLLAFI